MTTLPTLRKIAVGPQPAKGWIQHRRLRAGISLIELTIVILIVGILAAVGGLKYASALDTFRVQRSAERIAADIETARHASRSRNQNLTITFDVANHRYTISGLANPDRQSAGFEQSANDNVLITQIVSANFGGDTSLQFNNFGFPDSGGNVTLSSGNAVQTVTVTAGTGAVTVP